jgi:hypothetical protein
MSVTVQTSGVPVMMLIFFSASHLSYGCHPLFVAILWVLGRESGSTVYMNSDYSTITLFRQPFIWAIFGSIGRNTRNSAEVFDY